MIIHAPRIETLEAKREILKTIRNFIKLSATFFFIVVIRGDF